MGKEYRNPESDSMAHPNFESDHGMGSRGRGFTLQSLPSSDSTAHDSSEGYTPASPDPFHTMKNNTLASTDSGLRREKSEALLNNDWRHNRRPRAESEASPIDSNLRRASRSLIQQPRIESGILSCDRIKDTPVDPEMIKSAPTIGTLWWLPDRGNDGHDREEAPIRLHLDSLEKNEWDVIFHTRTIDNFRHLDETPNSELFASFAVKPFDDSQQDRKGSSLSCLLRRNSKAQRFKTRDWIDYDEEEWTILSNAVAKNQSRLLSTCQRKDGPMDKRVTNPTVRAESPINRERNDTETLPSKRFEDDARYKACVIDKLQKNPIPATSGFAAIPDSRNRFKAPTESHHGERQRHSPHVSNSGTDSDIAMNAAKDFKWNPNAPEFAARPPTKPPPATISCSDPSRARPPLTATFYPTPLAGCFDHPPLTGGFDPSPLTEGFDSALMMGEFDSQFPRGAFGAGNDYSLSAADHEEGTIAGTFARLRNMVDQLEVTAANQAERDRYLNYLSRMLLPGASQHIPGLQTFSRTQHRAGLQTHRAADSVFPPCTTIPFVGANSQLFSEPGAMVLPTFTAPTRNGAGLALPSVGPNLPFHAAPLLASAGPAPDPCSNGSMPTVPPSSNSNPVLETSSMQPNGPQSGLTLPSGSLQRNTFPSRRSRGMASDPVPCHPIFGPKPVEKPRGPPRPHNPLWNRQQQMYEAWLEWQRSVNPTRHLEGKERQNKRNERRQGSRRSESERATKGENEKPQPQVTVP